MRGADQGAHEGDRAGPVGAILPESGVTYYEVPAEYGVRDYRYTAVNNEAVLVDPRTHRLVQGFEQGTILGQNQGGFSKRPLSVSMDGEPDAIRGRFWRSATAGPIIMLVELRFIG